ncbi:MAG: hypothetical protein IKU48_06010 [Clostridia bacterium]|nr:hypothetical protein [Clostridia bacterium]
MAYGFTVNDGTTTTDYYYIHNLQGDVIGIVDTNGTKVVEYTYDAWGKILATTGTLATTIGELNPIRYRGYYYDAETGFYYCRARYYDPEICRWINPDKYVSTGQGLISFNMFAYCNNNPVNMVDSSGNYPITIGLIGVAIILLGGVLIILLDPNVQDALGEAADSLYQAVTSVGEKIQSATKATKNKIKEETAKEHTVYALVDSNNKVQYVGRTKNVTARRIAHKLNPERCHLKFKIIQDDLTYEQARAVEQASMLFHHTINTANKANNQINGISPKNWDYYKEVARGFLNYSYNQVSNEILCWLEDGGN